MTLLRYLISEIMHLDQGSTYDERDLLLRLGNGDEAAFRELYAHYWKKLYNAAFKRIADSTIVKDILQDVFLQVWLRRTSLKIDNLDAYFYNLYAEAETNFLVSGAFWKLREVALSYDLKINTNWIKQLTVTLAARNLFSLYPKTNRWGDPELTTGAGTVVRDDQKAASNLNGIFSEGSIGGSRFLGISLNAAF